MFPEFAYTTQMQLILAIVAFMVNFIIVYLIAGLILLVYGEDATVKQRSIFAFLIGVILNTAWSYAIYFIGGRSMSPTVYAFVVNPNPIFAMLYYLIGIKVLKLPRIRSIKLMGHVYLYYMLIKSLSSLLASMFFVQSPGRYNYLLDVYKNLAIFVVFLVIILITKAILQRNKQAIKLMDNLFINYKKELLIYFIKATVIYLLLVCIPFLFTEKIVINSIIFIVLALVFALSVLWDMYISTKNDAKNKHAHINILLRGILTDHANDIPQLSKKMNENPSLISELINKYYYARQMKVKMDITLQSRLDDFPIDNVDICVIISCLLDNAIQAAANSAQRKVFLAVESKDDGGKLIIINNSTATPIDTDKTIFDGIAAQNTRNDTGLAAVRKIASKYGNCTFQLMYYNYEVSAYFEIKQNYI